MSTSDLEDAINGVADRVRVDSAPLADGTSYRLRWGAQVDTHTISGTATRHGDSKGSPSRAAVVHPERVASYLAKYLTKATDDFGLPRQVRSARHAALAGASSHAVRIIETAQRLAGEGEEYALLLSHLGALGYRGHPITKSRAYSITFTQLRRARRRWRRNPAGLDPPADVRELLDDDHDIPDGYQLVSSWTFAGQGYLTLDQAAKAIRSATHSRIRAQTRRTPTTESETREAER